MCQSMCRRLEQLEGERLPCEYMDIMLPSMFVLQRNQHLQKIVETIGFQGDYDSDDLWGWLNGTFEGFGQDWWSNWMEVWATICETYIGMGKVGSSREQ